jgi:hypothetical protein
MTADLYIYITRELKSKGNLVSPGQAAPCPLDFSEGHLTFFRITVYNRDDYSGRKGGESEMKRILSVGLSLVLIVMFTGSLVGCGQEIKAENEKLKAENATLKADSDKAKNEIQKLKGDLQNAAEKDATISTLTAENDALKKELEGLKAKAAPAKAAPAKGASTKKK